MLSKYRSLRMSYKQDVFTLTNRLDLLFYTRDLTYDMVLMLIYLYLRYTFVVINISSKQLLAYERTFIF